MPDPVLVGIDVGGTFTDFVVWRDNCLTIHKAPTTPDDQSRAIVQGLHELGIEHETSLAIVHGMTVATNALLERRGAATALLTTAGFGDVIVIGRQNRPHLYRLSQSRPAPLAPHDRRFEVGERLDATGAVLRPLDESSFAALAAQLQAAGAESLAIVFLFSFRNPVHEHRAAALIRQYLPDLPISLSSAILPEYREYERMATTLINAYVQPLVARYLERLEKALRGMPSIRIMQSNGGVINLRQAADQAARVVLSGPAGGVVGAFAVASQALSPMILTFDMGGTSTDVCLCPGYIPTTAESVISDLPLRLPVIDIHTVGAGGGSIAFVDAGGALQVGPRSAGALPGPACYGRGGQEPTVTDANLVLGRLDQAGFLGGTGQVRLDVGAARAVIERLGAQLGLSSAAAALGVIRVANAIMERALRTVSVEQGYDPRAFTLLPFGGAGPLHACDLAEALAIPRILCPPMPGVLSAFGMLVADVTSDASQSVLSSVAALHDDLRPLAEACQGLCAKVEAAIAAERTAPATITAALDLRYRGQSYELTVPLALPLSRAALDQAVAAFHAAHAQRYGYAMPAESVEAVTLRVRATAAGASLTLPARPVEGADPSAARLADRSVWFDAAAPRATACYDRARLAPGNRLAGPAILLQYDSTVVVAPDWHGRIDATSNLWLEHAPG